MQTEPRLTLETTIQTDAIQGDAAIVRCTGKLTAGVTDILSSEIKRLIPDYKWVVLDLTNLTQMDSMGLGTVVRLYVSARSAGTSLQLINLSKRVRELLGITNLLHVFEVFGEERMRFP
ncbi:MAG: STAS domain-containing protein [Bryobacteraceae bacterium]|jgi:anti-anti-sigma factor